MATITDTKYGRIEVELQRSEVLRGEKGDPFRYEDFTPEQLAALKGEKGDIGNLVPEQEALLREAIATVSDTAKKDHLHDERYVKKTSAEIDASDNTLEAYNNANNERIVSKLVLDNKLGEVDSKITEATNVIQTNLLPELAKKVDKEEGKVLSSNDFTDEEKAKIQSIDVINNSIKILEPRIPIIREWRLRNDEWSSVTVDGVAYWMQKIMIEEGYSGSEFIFYGRDNSFEYNKIQTVKYVGSDIVCFVKKQPINDIYVNALIFKNIYGVGNNIVISVIPKLEENADGINLINYNAWSDNANGNITASWTTNASVTFDNVCAKIRTNSASEFVALRSKKPVYIENKKLMIVEYTMRNINDDNCCVGLMASSNLGVLQTLAPNYTVSNNSACRSTLANVGNVSDNSFDTVVGDSKTAYVSLEGINGSFYPYFCCNGKANVYFMQII